MDNYISTFDSGTEHSVKQITVDESQGVVVRTALGSIEGVPKGQKGVLVDPQREAALIETSIDADHLYVTHLQVDTKTGTVCFIGKSGILCGKFVDPSFPYITTQTIKNLNYNKDLDQFAITDNSGNVTYWSYFLDNIEVIES